MALRVALLALLAALVLPGAAQAAGASCSELRTAAACLGRCCSSSGCCAASHTLTAAACMPPAATAARPTCVAHARSCTTHACKHLAGRAYSGHDSYDELLLYPTPYGSACDTANATAAANLVAGHYCLSLGLDSGLQVGAILADATLHRVPMRDWWTTNVTLLPTPCHRPWHQLGPGGPAVVQRG